MNGEAVKLPLPAVEAVCSPRQEELEYLVGFFDGDGCVSMKEKTGEVQLVISQNIDSAEVLLRFRSLLGGSVYRHSAPTGSKKAQVQWRVYRSNMVAAAAETLSRVPSMKKAQLLIAAKGNVPKSDRPRLAQCLRMFKRRQHVPDEWLECSWPYFAGLFDAEGCILVRPSSVSLKLRLVQVNPCVLVHLVTFLHAKQIRRWAVYHGPSSSELVCSNLWDCKQTLELLLENGLFVKRRQALLALALKAENDLQIRDAISSLKGLQGRYKRLDSAGVSRAREIKRLQDRLHYIAGPERATMMSQIDELRAEHNLQKLISRCDLLRKDMRQSLRQGGRMVPPTTCSS